MKVVVPVQIIPIEEDGFHIITSALINGKEARMLIDTGASRTVVDEVRILGFPDIDLGTFVEMEKLSTGLGTNTMKSQTTGLARFEIGKFVLLEYSVVLINMSHVNESYKVIELPEIDGVIGGDILHKYGAVIDYGKSILTLEMKT